MISLNTIAMAFSAWLVVSSLLTFRNAVREEKQVLSNREKIRSALPALLNDAAAILVAAAIYLGAAPYLFADLGYIYLFAIVLFLTTTADTAVALIYPDGGEFSKTRLVAPGLTLVISLTFFSYILFMLSTPGSASDRIHLAYPVKGTWKVWAGGRTGWTNNHGGAAQRYAVDMRTDRGPTEGQDIYAPIEGKIVEAINDRTDDSPEPEGNVVIIECENGTRVWMAHLYEGSVMVRKGERVARGQPVAKCGMTGRNASMPHLHIHAQSGDKPVPMLFENEFLVRADRFSSL